MSFLSKCNKTEYIITSKRMREKRILWHFKNMKREREREDILVYICLNNIEKSDTSGLSLYLRKRKRREEKRMGGQVE